MLERNYHKISTMDCPPKVKCQTGFHSFVRTAKFKSGACYSSKKTSFGKKGYPFFCCLGYEFTLKHLIQIGDKPLSNSSWNRREHTRSSILDFDTKRAN